MRVVGDVGLGSDVDVEQRDVAFGYARVGHADG